MSDHLTCARCQTSYECFHESMADGLCSVVTGENKLHCSYGSSFDMSAFDVSGADVELKMGDMLCDGCIHVLLKTEQIREIN